MKTQTAAVPSIQAVSLLKSLGADKGTVAEGYMQALIAQLRSSMPQLPDNLSAVQNAWYFNYNYLDINGNFNAATYNFINPCFEAPSPGTVQANTNNPFNSAWLQLLAGIRYVLSSADQSAYNKAQLVAAQQQLAVVSVYQSQFNTITQDQMAAAQTALGWPAASQPVNKINYVIDYMMGLVWTGGTGQAALALTSTQMANADDLPSLLIKMPAGGDSVISAATDYFSVMGSNLQYTSELTYNNSILTSLTRNTKAPSASNGGMALNNAGTVEPGLVPGYAVVPSVQALQNALSDPQASAPTLTLSASLVSQGQYQVSIGAQGGFSVGSLIQVSASGSMNYDLASLSGAGSSYTVSIKYPGATLVKFTPNAWNGSALTGWFYQQVLQQAYRNWNLNKRTPGSAPTGFSFITEPAFDLDPIENGGNFGQLQSLVVSQFPTMQITFNSGNFSQFQQSFSQKVAADVSLFGIIPIASASESSAQSWILQQQSATSFTLTLSAPTMTYPVSVLDATSFVVAASVDSPASGR
ncbi:hypothetical protein D7V97_00040 [Corallococcus sp. CA053C]|uniref:hypothetical protein n=1 Tax=Corallococcus sp. CA053C TaxID=2316732 RepID=UPI000EA091B3|nr:hypothetical protein [Corallococcus sp. CA053C]RKH15421.1 hypothetical protein D7V97_00040 [Corallococcus sp. CA053C]